MDEVIVLAHLHQSKMSLIFINQTSQVSSNNFQTEIFIGYP